MTTEHEAVDVITKLCGKTEKRRALIVKATRIWGQHCHWDGCTRRGWWYAAFVFASGHV